MYQPEYLRQVRENLEVKEDPTKLRSPKFETSSGIPLKNSYTPADIENLDAVRDLGRPGKYPFTRHVQPTGFRGRLWTMRQYAGFGTAEESNKRYRYLLEQGQTGLSVAFDLPTQIGMDPDHAMAMGEVGKVGVSICSIRDMRVLFKDIPLDKVSTSMTINGPASVLLALYLAVAEEQGASWSQVSGTIQNDILKEYMARGTYIYPPRPSIRLITNIFEFCAAGVPNWNTISISGYHIREAGCTAAQEIAFTLADGIAYVEAALAAGMKLEDFAPRLSFFFNAHNQFFEEIAKFRAARRMWAKIIKERFGSSDPKSQMLRFHTQTAGSTLTAQQPDNNIVRTTVQAMAAVLGGTQSLHTNSRDEALALPTEVSARIALRTQQILAFESRIADTVDPFAGSYLIESLTDELEARAEALIRKVDEAGGMVSAIEKGIPQREIQNAAYEFQKGVERGEQVVVGVNKFTVQNEAKPDLLRVDEALGARRRAQVAQYRAERDNGAVRTKLDALTAASRGTDNLMPLILDAVKAEATVGEVCDAMRTVFGEYQERLVL
ncbi:acyl-CoA mutase large subunit family protein [Mesoterricola silvestris]|uniref:Methylmalonyl-CoA mutase n=1 Tax=Mesoterricola silvestris TaxID=2927979 RepID=A0AA48GSC8_9BACT|nr:methylmalonyl-CoA mutase family protein [Mesoterricola silvestris]BDU73112.1 methylmalonyl-CoA mutase [Mesoterricola silvestris]